MDDTTDDTTNTTIHDTTGGRDWRQVVGRDQSAGWAFRAMLVISVFVFVIVGRHQWFIRDDWALILTRRKMAVDSWSNSLFIAQDGHWMTVPILVYRAIHDTFGIDSYWPFLVVCLAAHMATIVLLRKICIRVGVSQWTATILCGMLLVFGSGWENIVFAVQITYNFSLLAFVAQLLLADHEGPSDRRDWIGAGVGLIGVMSSGFGPFFVGGIGLLLLIRRRWAALAINCGPMALAYLWWSLKWGGDNAADAAGRPLGRLPDFVYTGITAVFEGLTPLPSLVGVAALATTAILVWRARDADAHDVLVALGATVLAMFVGVGFQRVGLGVETAAASRYVYIGGILLVPAFGLAVDQMHRLGEPALLAGRLALCAAVVTQVGTLHSNGESWANISSDERSRLELIAGAPLPADFDMSLECLKFSPDVRCGDIAGLVDEGAIAPRQAANDLELVFVEQVRAGLIPP